MKRTNLNYKTGLRAVLSALILLTACFCATAETVSQKQAMNMAQQFFNAANGQVMAPVKLVYNGRNLTTNRLFVPFYVYNLPGRGFVIISAENKTYPILGFCLKENFDPDRLGEKEKALLRSYALDIEKIRYDSRVPFNAIEAWRNYPEYVDNILKEPYRATDPSITDEESAERINQLIESGIASETASDIYTPEQWTAMITDELENRKNIPFAIIENETVLPLVIYGHQGEFFRIKLDGRNNWLMRLLPSEILSGMQIADFSYPKPIPLPSQPDTTYKFYDDFAEEVHAQQAKEPEPVGIEAELAGGKPVMIGIGGGHYAIMIPENVERMVIYNLAGNIVNIRTFKSTNTAHADISIEPAGFYFAQLYGKSGKTYGVKLVR